MRIKVYRQAETTNYHLFDVKLNKKPGKSLGLSIVGRCGGNGIFVSEVFKGGSAEQEGSLIIGDEIMQVNGLDVTNIDQTDAATILKVNSYSNQAQNSF